MSQIFETKFVLRSTASKKPSWEVVRNGIFGEVHTLASAKNSPTNFYKVEEKLLLYGDEFDIFVNSDTMSSVGDMKQFRIASITLGELTELQKILSNAGCELVYENV